MEIHRLLPMKDNYDEKLFNELYNQTSALRKSLVYQIDARRFGVTSDIIESWFDDKFIFVFNKYYGTMDKAKLKSYIINSLRTFKFRMLRGAYLKSNIYNDSIHIEDNDYYINIIPQEEAHTEYEELLELALAFMKKRLSPDASLILDIDLNPPPYILNRLKQVKTKIPVKLIAEYLDLDNNQDVYQYINHLRSEVSECISLAKEFFK